MYNLIATTLHVIEMTMICEVFSFCKKNMKTIIIAFIFFILCICYHKYNGVLNIIYMIYTLFILFFYSEIIEARNLCYEINIFLLIENINLVIDAVHNVINDDDVNNSKRIVIEIISFIIFMWLIKKKKCNVHEYRLNIQCIGLLNIVFIIENYLIKLSAWGNFLNVSSIKEYKIICLGLIIIDVIFILFAYICNRYNKLLQNTVSEFYKIQEQFYYNEIKKINS